MNCNAKMAFSSRSRYIRRSSGPGMNWRESMSHELRARMEKLNIRVEGGAEK